MSRWFRHYAGMMRDEKLVSAAVKAKQPVERVVWVWGAILESAAEEQDGGRYEFDCGEAAYFLRCEDGDLEAVVSALSAVGRLHEGIVVKWSERQFESDSSTERVRGFRSRKQDAKGDVSERGNVPNEHGNGEETLQVVSVTPPETETETEKKKVVRKKNYPEEFLGFWSTYPADPGMSKVEAFAAWEHLTAEDHQSAIDALPAFKTWVAKQGTDYRTVHACRYLSKRRFDGFKAQVEKAKETPTNGQVYVKQGTDAWDAWERVYRATKGKPPTKDFNGGWWFPSEYPKTERVLP